MTNDVTERSFDELTEEECWDLIRGHTVGRLALSGEGGLAPYVFPVNYVADGDSVVFRSAAGTKLSLIDGRPVAFEIDHVDVINQSGWSVLLRGRAHELTHWESDHIEILTWAPGERTHFIRVVPGTVTGRRISGAQWVDVRGYL